MIAEEATSSSFNVISPELGDGWRYVDSRLVGQALVTVACFFLRLKSTSKKQKPKSRLPMHWFGWLASLGDSSVMLWRVLSFWGCWSCCVCRVFSCVFVRGVLVGCALPSVVGFVCVRDVGVLSLCTFKSLFCWASDGV